VIDGDLTVANISGKDGMRYSLTVRGDINARDINACDVNAFDVNARNVNALDVNAHDIDAHDINARNVNAYFILCESIKQKEGSKLIAKNIITKRSGYERKEMKLKE
jgi:hypothetical protein